jgi:hypothetical protein
MKRIIKMTTVALLLGTSSLLASNLNSYTITNEYKLLNDMNLARKQSHLISKMNKALKTNHVDMRACEEFTKVLLGLANGDESLNLKGTNIPEIQLALSKIQKLWKIELSTLKNANSNKDIKKAIDILKTVTIKINHLVSLYDKSYHRFEQKTKLSFVVKQYNITNQKQFVAFNLK